MKAPTRKATASATTSDQMNEAEAGLFRRMFKSGLFELMGTDRSFEFGLILLGIEQVIREQEGVPQ